MVAQWRSFGRAPPVERGVLTGGICVRVPETLAKLAQPRRQRLRGGHEPMPVELGMDLSPRLDDKRLGPDSRLPLTLAIPANGEPALKHTMWS